MLTIVTATFNSSKTLPTLVSSLDAQTDRDFRWIVVDGCSKDSTVNIAKSAKTDTTVIADYDKGIYDALNKAIGMVDSGYYLVIGSDDILYPSAVEYLNYAIRQKPTTIISGVVKCGSSILSGGRGKVWYRGMLGAISQHSVGTAFDVRLHEKYGLYPLKYGTAGDNYFVMSCIKGGEKVTLISDVLGEFGVEGISSRDPVGNIFQNCRIAVELGLNPWVQVFVLAARLFTHKTLH